VVTPDLTAFLRARLDEDANDIASASPMPGRSSRLATMQGTTVLMDATRAIAEVDAKRRILDWAGSPALPAYERLYVLDALALPYASHPDYQKTWAP